MKKVLKIIGIVLIILIILLFFGIRFISKNSYGRVPKPEHTYKYYYEHYEKDYPRKQVTIKSGKYNLAGFIYGEDNDKALLVFSHGSGCFHEDYMKEIIWFVDHGYKVFAADYTASGYSEGENTGGLPKTPIDLDKILTYIENDEELSKMDKVLIGHSWGAYGVTAVLNYDHDIKAVVSLAAYNEPASQVTDIMARSISPVFRIFKPFFWISNKIDYGKYGDLTAVDGINHKNIPVLVVHGTGDQMISYERESIPAHKKEITNPNVKYKILTEDGYNDHESFFYTKEANDVINEFNEKSMEIAKKYNGKVPEDEIEKLYSELDKELLNTPNEEFLSEVDKFFDEALSK